MTEEFKKNASMVFVALFCVLYLVLVFLTPPTPPPDPAWTSRAALTYLEASMKQFCAGLYPDESDPECPNVSFSGKMTLIKSTRFHALRAPSIDLVTAVLNDKGWLLTDPSDRDSIVFCRDGYAALYSTNGERVWIQFMTGKRTCLK